MSENLPRATPAVGNGAGTCSPEPASPELARFLHAVEAHVVSEADTIAAYRQLGTASHDPLVIRLMQLLLDEEERHHQVFRDMASYVRSDVTWGTGYESALHPADPRVLASIQHFISQERDSARELRHLASNHSGLYGGLFSLLLDLMGMDSEKHAYILAFVLKQLGGEHASNK